MFLTITIDTSLKANKKVKFNQSKVQAFKGWKKAKNGKSPSILRRLKQLFKVFKEGRYKLGRQVIGY